MHLEIVFEGRRLPISSVLMFSLRSEQMSEPIGAERDLKEPICRASLQSVLDSSVRIRLRPERLEMYPIVGVQDTCVYF